MSNIWLVLSAKRPRGCELIKSSQCFHIVGILTQLTIISYNLQLHPPFLQLGVVYAVFHHPHLWPLVRHADRLAHKVTSPTSTQRTSLGPIRLDISCFFDFPEQTAGDPKKREPLERNEMIWSGLLLSPQSVKSNHHWQSLGSSFRIENIFQNQIMCSSPSITAWFWHIHIYLFFLGRLKHMTGTGPPWPELDDNGSYSLRWCNESEFEPPGSLHHRTVQESFVNTKALTKTHNWTWISGKIGKVIYFTTEKDT